jgi:glycosyltransferase involved in cell wall biosynthesis
MKILVVSETNPFHLMGGEVIRLRNIIKALHGFASVYAVVLDCHAGDSRESYISANNPFIESVVRISKQQFWGDGLIERLRPQSSVLGELAKISEEIKPDIVLLDYAYIAHYRTAFPKCKVIFNTQNVQSQIDQQIALLPNPNLIKKIYSNLVWRASQFHEKTYLPACDVVFAVSEEDAKYYRSFINFCQLEIVPNFIDLSEYPSQGVSGSEQSKKKIIFTGSMDAFQNQRAGDFLLNQIWPKVLHAVPECQLYIVGKNPPSRWLKLSQPHVHVTGRVDSPIPFLQAADVAIVPLLDGSGTRFKILEAMACGVPVVSTPLGCQGLNAQWESDILVAEGADTLADKVIQLLQSPQQRMSLAANAYRLVQQKYSLEANASKLRDICYSLIGA